ncbi:hypothetical protein EAO77_14535 [Streptomyces sp. t39]|nr:hypothetical protein EAO77_14535 [Streptomyces sp. t39]
MRRLTRSDMTVGTYWLLWSAVSVPLTMSRTAAPIGSASSSGTPNCRASTRMGSFCAKSATRSARPVLANSSTSWSV